MDSELLTVGVVVWNRAWVISKMLDSLNSQTYPHDKIYVVVVDNESTDGTLDLVRQFFLNGKDFYGHKIISQKCNIPQGRNLAIKNMLGDYLVFWDSDVIMEPTALMRLFNSLKENNADIAMAGNSRDIFFNSEKELTDNTPIFDEQPNRITDSSGIGMGQTMIAKKVFDAVTFDEDLCISEDDDFGLRAKKKGFKTIVNTGISIFDLNIGRIGQSDIHVDMPLRDAMSNMRKKAKARAFGCSPNPKFKDVLFIVGHKRYAYYLGYIPTLLLFILGILTRNVFLLIIFPLYLGYYVVVQIRRRGLKKGLIAVDRSFLVGVPTTLWLLYYLIKRPITKEAY